MVVCTAGRTGKLRVSETDERLSRSVHRLCKYHACDQPVEYWCTFREKFRKAGLKPSTELIEKIGAWIQLSVRMSMYRSMMAGNTSQRDCETTGCQQRSLCRHSAVTCTSCLQAGQFAKSRICCTSGCHNSLTSGGFCNLCCEDARRSKRSAVAGRSASELGQRSRTCVNAECMKYVAGDNEFCSECLQRLGIEDSHTARRCETVRAENVDGGELCDLDSNSTPVTAAEDVVKSRRSLLSSNVSPSTDIGVKSSQPTRSTTCIAPVCHNAGSVKYNGLCEACFNVLVEANSPQHQMPVGHGS